jgi:hypothetical protein
MISRAPAISRTTPAPGYRASSTVGKLTEQGPLSHWRRRFEAERLAGLEDRPRPGRPLVYGHDQRLRIVATVTQEPPDPASHWSHRQLATRWPTSASPPPRSAGSSPTSTSSPTGCAAGSPAPMTPPSGSARLMSAGCTCCRRPTRWCCRWMRRPESVPAAAPGRPSRLPPAARPAKSTSTSAMAPRPCWLRWTCTAAGSSKPPT